MNIIWMIFQPFLCQPLAWSHLGASLGKALFFSLNIFVLVVCLFSHVFVLCDAFILGCLYSALVYFSSQASPGQAEGFSIENSISRFAIVLPSHRYRHTLQRNGIPLPRMGVGRASLNPGKKAVLLLATGKPKLKNSLDKK